jgi:hypothetical protein
MFFIKFLPDVLKELVKHVPTLMFEVVDWSELMTEIPVLSGRLLRREGYQDLFKSRSTLFSKTNIVLNNSLKTKGQVDSAKEAGEAILKVYFSQLYSEDGLFLDLRLSHFSFTGEQLIWEPSPLWTRFNAQFRQGVIHLYRGFYLQDDRLFEQGLLETGLLKENWSQATQGELKSLFRAHFGNSINGEVIFSIAEFQASFIKIADFLLTNKAKMSQDFLYLGIYLVTLYLSLEQLKGPLPVGQIFREVDQSLG